MLVYRRRKELGLSQKELGERLTPPVTQPIISTWENGTAPIPENRYEQLAKELHVSVSDLVVADEYVRDDARMKEWRDLVTMHVRPIEALVVLLAFQMFFDDDTELVMVSQASLLDRVDALTVGVIQKAWPYVLSSPFVERYGTSEWVFRLRVPKQYLTSP